MNLETIEKANRLQIELCKKYKIKYFPLDWNLKIGLSKNFDINNFPINGLRHPQTSHTTGWYIWSGEEFSKADDFFQPIHAYHLIQQYPELVKYLGLPKGYRFLFDTSKGDEDIWEDKNLLNI